MDVSTAFFKLCPWRGAISVTIIYSHGASGLPILAQKVCVAIGSFDGCHLGHQELLSRTVAMAKHLGVAPAVLTFDPSPQVFFHKSGPEGLIFSRALKNEALFEAGIQIAIVQRFDTAFSQINPDQFVRSFLLGQLKVAGVVVGKDFKFGVHRSGDVHMLKLLLGKNIPLEICTAETYKDTKISSSAIRKMLVEDGDVGLAQKLLGRPFILQGRIIRGEAVGRGLGFPTANLAVDPGQLLPKRGVYAGYVAVDELTPMAVLNLPKGAWLSVFNIGYRPTVNPAAPTEKDTEKGESREKMSVEGHIIEGHPTQTHLYGRDAYFYLIERLRNEQKFSSREALVKQIEHDVARAMAVAKA